MKKFTLAALLISSILAAGCATSPLSGTTADEVAIAALRQNAQERKYNFAAEVRLSEIKSLAPKEASAADAARQQQWLASGNRLADAMSVKMGGAVDLDKKQIEILPALHIDHRNISTYVAFPMRLDGQQFSMIIDPAAAALFDFTGTLPEGKYIRIALPPEYVDKIKYLDFGKIITDLQEKMLKNYTEIDKQAYSFVPLTQADLDMGGKQKIRLYLTAENLSKFYTNSLIATADVLTTHLKNEKTKDLAATLLLLASLAGVDNQHANDITVDFILNRQGQIAGIHEALLMHVPDTLSARVSVLIRFSNYGHPTFTLHPQEQEIVDYKDTKLALLLGKDNDKSGIDSATTPLRETPKADTRRQKNRKKTGNSKK